MSATAPRPPHRGRRGASVTAPRPHREIDLVVLPRSPFADRLTGSRPSRDPCPHHLVPSRGGLVGGGLAQWPCSPWVVLLGPGGCSTGEPGQTTEANCGGPAVPRTTVGVGARGSPVHGSSWRPVQFRTVWICAAVSRPGQVVRRKDDLSPRVVRRAAECLSNTAVPRRLSRCPAVPVERRPCAP